MRQWLRNVMRLCGKEFHSLASDYTLLLLIVFAFSAAIYSVANGVKAEVANASVAVLDNDRSNLSYRLRDAILPPYFKPPEAISRDEVDAALNRGRYIFVLEIPPNFERDVLARRQPSVQILVDATAMTQAGLGVTYLNEIIAREVLGFLHAQGIEAQLPVVPVTRQLFNPNAQSPWYTAVMQIVTNVTVLAIILVGATVIREREHGTIEHLLVMPVRASEIAMAKILSNGLVILVAAMLSLRWVVQAGLGIPLHGSEWLFMAGLAIYLFSVTALGMYLATLAPTMPQFGLLAVPVYVVAYLLSGAATPVESMPSVMQSLVPILPTTQFVMLTQAVLYRGAGFAIVWPQFLAIAVCGGIFLGLALRRFRSMLARQG
ncbi:ABC transporter permease [Bordetella holmesii]|uniref:ABC transporter permease n=1 Tax=Bordetella holmesii TaxID=35814 RepID=UPI00129881DA|nr:ABC transporter permease [Bordetella holmesii]QGE28448.1 ABC transporter permease [Bordetella holmesii]QGE39112.1 ABC transporter permease [Bordetella holmesii]QGE42354.1 ABC transporter permease [Bordetella holmesii]QGE45601.1 ABC transporter permease [Bordetella holmesii]QGE77070.1 ABC transporter permease [Bordetella holmesii]